MPPPAKQDFAAIVQTLVDQARFASDETMHVVVAQLLDSGSSPTEVAAQLDVPLSWIKRMSRAPIVREALARGRQERVAALHDRLVDAGEAAIDLWVKIVRGDVQASAEVRAHAAEKIMQYAVGKPSAATGTAMPTIGTAVEVRGPGGFRARLAQVVGDPGAAAAGAEGAGGLARAGDEWES